MEWQLVEDGENKKMSFYAKCVLPSNADHINLLGFKDNYPVLEPSLTKIKYISVAKSQLKTDKQGQQFYNWKGRIIKIVPPDQIPKSVREQRLKLKNQGAKGRNPNAVPIDHVNKDNDVNIACFSKDVGQITELADNQVIHCAAVESSGFPVNPLIVAAVKPTVLLLSDPSALISRGKSDSAASNTTSTVRTLPTTSSRAAKLLSRKNLDILNQVKMRALNLSMKAIIDGEKAKEIGVQTEEQDAKQFCHQQVQTDLAQDFNLVNFMTLNLENVFDINAQEESPIINDVRLDNCSTQNNSDGKQADDKQVLRMKMMFFNDLRECMNYNAAGNL